MHLQHKMDCHRYDAGRILRRTEFESSNLTVSIDLESSIRNDCRSYQGSIPNKIRRTSLDSATESLLFTAKREAECISEEIASPKQTPLQMRNAYLALTAVVVQIGIGFE